MKFLNDTNYLFSGGDDGLIYQWDFKINKVISRIDLHKWKVYSLHFSPDNKFCASGYGDGCLVVWNIFFLECSLKLYLDFNDPEAKKILQVKFSSNN